MKPIFCGNLDFDARQSDVERLFRRYGKVDRVDMKSGMSLFIIYLFFLVITLSRGLVSVLGLKCYFCSSVSDLLWFVLYNYEYDILGGQAVFWAVINCEQLAMFC